MDNKLLTLVENLTRVKMLTEGFEQLAEAKLVAVNELHSSLTDEVKQTLRVGMDFKLVKKGRFRNSKKSSFDERGQEYAVDVVGSVKEGYRLRGNGKKGDKKKKEIIIDGEKRLIDEWSAMNEAYRIVIDLTKKALDKKLPAKNGGEPQPVYDLRPIVRNGEPIETEEQAIRRVNGEIERDIFTPLVREGLLPETFVLDEYSQVADLIKNSIKSYKETTQRKKEETEEKFAKNNFTAAGGGKKATDRLSGIGGKLGRMVDQRLGDNASDIKRQGKVGVDLLKAGKEGVAGFTTLKGVINGKALERAKDFLDPKGPEALKKLSPARLKELGLDKPNVVMSKIDEDKIRLQLENQYKEDRIFGKGSPNLSGDQLTTPMKEEEKKSKENLLKLYERLNSDPVFYTQKSVELVSDYGGATSGIISDIAETTKAYGEKVFAKRPRIVVAAGRTAELIDEYLKGVVRDNSDLLGTAFEGAYAGAFNVDDVLKTLVDESGEGLAGAVDFAKIAKAYATPFEKAFAKVSPKSKTEDDVGGKEQKPKVDIGALLKAAGQKLATEFADRAEKDMTGNKKDFQKNLEEQPELAFAPLFLAATGCFDNPPKEFTDAVEAAKENDVAREMISASLDLGDEAKLEELMRTEDEAKDFQKQLVLVDKGTMSVKTLEAMIQELKESKAVLDLVGTIGKALFTAPNVPIQIAGRAAKDLTAEVTGEVVMALKAAKLIMELVVNIKKAVDRWTLFFSFKESAKRSRVAVSPLTSTIQGFYNNKKEQVTLNTINDVLMIVQVAGNIVGSVPTPYTLVIGKTMDKVAGAIRAGNKVAGELYNEKMLSKGWAATKKAISDPTNRAQGLKALRLNPTLGMHSIAWAAMEKTPPDAIARSFLADLGVTEQTLAADGTERKVLEYLQTLLDEDRSLIDFNKINSKWAPDNPELTLKDWFITVSRGRNDAEPPLAKGGDEAILAAFKSIDKRKESIADLEQRAETGAISFLEVEELIEETEDLCAALDDYEPLTTDGKSHDEMLLVAGGFLKKAGDRRDELNRIANTNSIAAMQNPDLLAKSLNAISKELETVVAHDKDEVTNYFTIERMLQLQGIAKKTVKQIFDTVEIAEGKNVDFDQAFESCTANLEKLNELIFHCDPQLALEELQEHEDKLNECENIPLHLLNDPSIGGEIESICQRSNALVESVLKTGTQDQLVTESTQKLQDKIFTQEKKLKEAKEKKELN